METDIGNPIDYDPSVDSLNSDNRLQEEPEQSQPQQSHDESYYYQPQQMLYQPQMTQPEKVDLFSNIEKSTWIIAFAVFLLGFFMGKTMQPVILRYT
jgi:hypothetical protein